MNDIKDILIRSNRNEINKEETFNEISNLIKENGYFSGNEIELAFNLGKNGQENNITSNDNILEIIGYDLDEFSNFISMNGFFSQSDIDTFYKMGQNNKSSEKNGDVIKELSMKAFNMYLLLNWD